MNIWAIVPVKPFNRAKSRLADELSPEQREMLAAGLFEHTLSMLLPMSQVQGVLVISRDTKALAMARERGAQTVQESGTPELNHALLRATQVTRTWGSDACLIVPADIPLLAAEDVEAVVKLGQYHGTVVLVPDRHEHGTNLLLVHPPAIIPYSFGEDSFAAHQRLARDAGASVLIYRSERAALDLDTPPDLLAYYELAKLLREPLIRDIGSPNWLMAEKSPSL